jgi:Ca2+-binding RTX toxin-like protein
MTASSVAGADVMTGGAGADIFVIGAADTGVTNAAVGVVGNIDEITDFVSGTDKLDILGATTGAGLVIVTAGAAVANYAAALAAAEAAFGGDTTTNVYVATITGGGVYVFYDTAPAGTTGPHADGAIWLSGTASLTAGDLI